MVKAKTVLMHTFVRFLFSTLLLAIFFSVAALSLMPIPFASPPLSIHFFAIMAFVSLFYLPPKLWPFLVLPSLWLDFITGLPLGAHATFVALQYGALWLMRTFVKDYGFVSHWAVFSFSFALIYRVWGDISLLTIFCTVLAYPLILSVLVGFFSRFRPVSYA